MEGVLRESFIQHLVQPLFDDILIQLKTKYVNLSRPAPVCMVSYTWPLLPEEEGLQERVLQMCEDLQSVGILSFMDITRGDSSTLFCDSLPKWIHDCEFVILVGSSSYPTRTKNPSTLTSLEASAIGMKKKINSNSIIPVLFEGRFGTSFPPGYQDTIGGRFIQTSDYMKELPGVAASILGISDDRAIIMQLDSYTKEVQSIIKSATLSKEDRGEVLANLEIQKQYWKSRLLTLHSKFSLEQLRLIDGNVDKRTKLIDDYSAKTIASLQYQSVSSDPSSSSSLPFSGQASFNQLSTFLSSPCKVLLLHAPLHLFTHLCDYLALEGTKHNMVPIFVDLATINNPVDQLVEQSLMLQLGMDNQTIEQAKREREFLIVVKGFEEKGMYTNLYVRNQMSLWPGKVVFTCSLDSQKSPNLQLYFMPASSRSHQVPDPSTMSVIVFNEDYSTQAPTTQLRSENALQNNFGSPTIGISLGTEANNDKRAHGAVTVPIRSERPTINAIVVDEDYKRNEKGFLLLQQDITRVDCHKFLTQLHSLAITNENITSKSHIQAFISYAWPQDIPTRDYLQHQLLDLVEDLSKAGISAILDIMHLHPGSDVKLFMNQEIDKSHTVLWIGTPDLKARIKFESNGNPSTNAAIEFSHIQNKQSQTVPFFTIQSLLFQGNSELDSYPDNHGLNCIHHNFTNRRNYFLNLPLLVASIFGISKTELFEHVYYDYCSQIQHHENNFTQSAINTRFIQEEHEVHKKQLEANEKLKTLLKNIPISYLQEQQNANFAKKQALVTLLLQLKQKSLSPHTPHAQALEYYVPLKGGPQSNSDPQQHFEAFNRILTFLENDNSTAIIFGGAGSGKSLFARFIERSLWNAWNRIDLNEIIPIFISLSQYVNPTSQQDIVQQVLLQHFFPDDIDVLLSTGHFLFILDGLDEVALDLLPPDNFFQHTHLFKWTLAKPRLRSKVIVLCRTQHIPTLEYHLGMTIQQYLTGSLQVESFHLMPFTGTQISHFLQGFSQSPDSQANWTSREYELHISNIQGLSSLVTIPFLLKLIVKILPQLIADKQVASITTNHIYQEFTKQLFQREAWKRLTQGEMPLARDLCNELQILSQNLAQLLFENKVTTTLLDSLKLDTGMQDLLTSIPVHIAEGMVTFIHKSIQEFFVAQLWMQFLDKRDSAKLLPLICRRLISQEQGVLGLISTEISHHLHTDILMEQVNASRTNKGDFAAIASSNALTILNASSLSFSSMNLSGIEAPCADLRNAIMEGTDLSRSNLAGALIHGAWFRYANLQNCVFNNVQLGELMWIPINSPCWRLCSVDLDTVVSGHEDGTVNVWDVTKNIQIGKTLQAQSRRITCLAVSDGLLVSSSLDSTIAIWDLATMTLVHLFEAHKDGVDAVTLCEGKIFSTGQDRNLRVWDISTMVQKIEPIHVEHLGVVKCLATLNRKLVYSKNKKLIVWDMDQKKQIGKPLRGHTGEVSSLAVMNSNIISGSYDATVRVWDMENMEQIGDTLKGHIEGFTCVTVIGGKIVSGGADKTIRVWDAETMTKIGKPLYNNTPVFNIAIVNNTITVGTFTTIKSWNFSAVEEVGDTTINKLEPIKNMAVCFGKIVTASEVGRKITIMDKTMKQREGAITFYSYGNIAVTNGMVAFYHENAIEMWDLETMKLATKVSSAGESVYCIATTDGKIVGGDTRATLRVWDVESKLQIGRDFATNASMITSIAVSDGIILAGDCAGVITLVDLNLMNLIGTLKCHDIRVTCIAAEMQVGKIVSGNFDGTVMVWDIVSRHVHQLQAAAAVMSIAVMSGVIIAGLQDGIVDLWDLKTMKRIGFLIASVEGINCIAVHDGKLVTAGEDGIVRVWHKPPGKPKGAHLFHLERCSASLPLNFEDCNIKGAKGLSVLNERVMRQRGACYNTKEYNEHKGAPIKKPAAFIQINKERLRAASSSFPFPPSPSLFSFTCTQRPSKFKTDSK